MKIKEELCIMPANELYSTTRFIGSHRHEVFYGKNRQKSIELGLVVFLTPEQHNMSEYGVHFNKSFDNILKRIGQKAYMNYYNKNRDEFISVFGRNYIE